jgi:hypothetical protein
MARLWRTQRLLALSELEPQRAEVAPHAGIIRREPQRALQAHQRLVEASEPALRDRQETQPVTSCGAAAR